MARMLFKVNVFDIILELMYTTLYLFLSDEVSDTSLQGLLYTSSLLEAISWKCYNLNENKLEACGKSA